MPVIETVQRFGLGFGRDNAELPPPDPRDRRFPLADAVPSAGPTTPPARYWWANGWWGDQLKTPQCVAYAWVHALADGPVTQLRGPGGGPVIDPFRLYKEAQARDEWPGDRYDGTSVRGGAEALRARGYLTEYRWAWDLDTALDAIRSRGPVIVGSWWYEDMFWPNGYGVMRATGKRAGGHAFVVNGVNLALGLVRVKNSWGREWCRGGHAFLPLSDFARLIREDGEVCMPTEIRPVAAGAA